MPNSLTKTTVALLLAAFAVLVTAGIAMRDFIRDVNAQCPGVLLAGRPNDAIMPPNVTPVRLLSLDEPAPPAPTASFRVVYDVVAGSYPTRYENVRVEWRGWDADAPCVCGAVPVVLQPGEGPWSLSLGYASDSAQYTVSLHKTVRATFSISASEGHRVQVGRIISRRHLSLAVSFAAFLALGVAWLRQKKARAYALVMHAWREADLTSGQMIQSETGEMLGALASSSRRIWQRAGKVLVAPEALGGSGLYRDVPVIEARHVARGTHEEWARATMIRLRDARALAVLSTLTSVLALAAHRFA